MCGSMCGGTLLCFALGLTQSWGKSCSCKWRLFESFTELCKWLTHASPCWPANMLHNTLTHADHNIIASSKLGVLYAKEAESKFTLLLAGTCTSARDC